MTGLLLTHSFSSRNPADEAEAWAILHERGMRELRWRMAPNPAVLEVTLAASVPARDAGDVCGACGELVTWVDHLPPVDAKSAVRCFKDGRKGVEQIYNANAESLSSPLLVLVETTDTTDEQERSFRESFGYAVNDPKHPDYHDTYAEISDSREDF